MSREKIIKKYQLLINLAKDQETEEEKSAWILAQSLKEKYKLSNFEVREKKKSYTLEHKILSLSDKINWKIWLAEIVAKCSETKLVEEISIGNESGSITYEYFIAGCGGDKAKKLIELYNRYNLICLGLLEDEVEDEEYYNSYIMGVLTSAQEFLFEDLQDIIELTSEDELGGSNITKLESGLDVETDLPEPPQELKETKQESQEINAIAYFEGIAAFQRKYNESKDIRKQYKNSFRRQ